MDLKLSSRDTLIVAVLGIVLVAGLVVAFVIMPRYSQIGRLNAEMAQAEQQIIEAKALLSRRQQAKEESAWTQAKLLTLAGEMPDSPEMPTLIIELQDTANESGLDFTEIKPQEPAADQGFSKIGLDMTVKGEWSDVIEYLRRLSKLDRKVRITKVSVSPDNAVAGGTTDSDEPQQVQVQITVFAYTLGASTQAAPPATPAPAQ